MATRTLSAPGLRARRAPLAWLAVLAMLAGPTAASAQAVVSEPMLLARITLTLMRFVQWPPAVSGGEALRLCVMTRQPDVWQAFAAQDGQAHGGRTVRVVALPPGIGPGQAGWPGCHALFAQGPADRLGELAGALGRGAVPVLTVSDAEGFMGRGGMVELLHVNDAIRFDISLRALRAAQLDLSSQVLKLARQVRE